MRYVSLMLLCYLAACGTDVQSGLALKPESRAALGAYSAATIPSQHDPSLCLGTAYGSTAPGTPIVLAPCNSSEALSWALNNGALTTTGALCLDVVDGANANGTRLQLWTCGPSNANQKFVINGGALMWLNKNRCLDVTHGTFATGTAVQVWECDISNTNQQWQLGQ